MEKGVFFKFVTLESKVFRDFIEEMNFHQLKFEMSLCKKVN